jgi:hypothetical protein
VDFGGSDMRSLNDVQASIQGTLSEAEAFQLPVLGLLTPYLVPGQGATTFQTGEVKARLAGGVIRISELTMESPLVMLMLQGSVTVQGRLDLAVTARTTPLGGVNPTLVRVLLRQLPPVGPVPVGLLVQATELLSERTVYLRVGGTVKAPVVQVEPLRTLSEEATRFFLGRALGPGR